MQRNSIGFFLLFTLLFAAANNLFAQHSLQLNDGSAVGRYSIILPQSGDAGSDKYQLPANGGTTSTIVTMGGVGSSVSTSWLQGGNTNAAITGYGTLGTRDAVDMTLVTSNSARMTIQAGGNVGVRTTTPNSTVDVNGSVGAAIRLAVGGDSPGNNDYTIINQVVNNIYFIPPAAANNARRIYVLVNQDANPILLLGATYLDFTNNPNFFVNANSSITIQSDGTNWYQIH